MKKVKVTRRMLEAYVRKILTEARTSIDAYSRLYDASSGLNNIKINKNNPASLQHLHKLASYFASQTGMRDGYGAEAERITAQVIAPNHRNGNWMNLNPGSGGLNLGSTADLPGADVGSTAWPKSATVTDEESTKKIKINADNYSVKSSHVASGGFSTGLLPLIKLMGWCLHFDSDQSKFPWIASEKNQQQFPGLIINNLQDGDEIEMPFGLYYFQVTPYDADNPAESTTREGVVLNIRDTQYMKGTGIRRYTAGRIYTDDQVKGVETWNKLDIPRPIGGTPSKTDPLTKVPEVEKIPLEKTDDNTTTRKALLNNTNATGSRDSDKVNGATAKYFRVYAEALFRTFYLHYDELSISPTTYQTLSSLSNAIADKYLDSYYKIYESVMLSHFSAANGSFLVANKSAVKDFLEDELFHKMYDLQPITKQFQVVTPQKNVAGNFPIYIDIFHAPPDQNTFKLVRVTRTVTVKDENDNNVTVDQPGYETYWNGSLINSSLSKKEQFQGLSRVARIDLTGEMELTDYFLRRGDYTELFENTLDAFYAGFTDIYSSSDYESHKAATRTVSLPSGETKSGLDAAGIQVIEEATQLGEDILNLIDLMSQLPQSASITYALQAWAIMQAIDVEIRYLSKPKKMPVSQDLEIDEDNPETFSIVRFEETASKLDDLISLPQIDIFQRVMPQSFDFWLKEKKENDPNYTVPESVKRTMRRINNVLYAQFPEYKEIMKGNAGIASHLFENKLEKNLNLSVTYKTYVHILKKFKLFLIAMSYQSIAEQLGVVEYTDSLMGQTIDITPDNQDTMGNESSSLENLNSNDEIKKESRLYESILLDLMEASAKKQRAANQPKKIKLTKRSLNRLLRETIEKANDSAADKIGRMLSGPEDEINMGITIASTFVQSDPDSEQTQQIKKVVSRHYDSLVKQYRYHNNELETKYSPAIKAELRKDTNASGYEGHAGSSSAAIAYMALEDFDEKAAVHEEELEKLGTLIQLVINDVFYE